MSASNYVHLEDAVVKRVTDKAALIVPDGGDPVWIPLSQIADGDDLEAGDEPRTVSVTQWIAEQKNLEVE